MSFNEPSSLGLKPSSISYLSSKVKFELCSSSIRLLKKLAFFKPKLEQLEIKSGTSRNMHIIHIKNIL